LEEGLRYLSSARHRSLVTDRVLRELLPHTDSQKHREAGAWISVGPAITGDVRSFFEAAGWQQPGEWQEVAEALLAFVERCAGAPSELDAACSDFSASRLATGFQTGMLSPILNALRPDDFLLVNNKSRRLINYLSGESFSQKLVDYPAINETGHRLVEDLADLLETAPGGSGRRARSTRWR
jgi:5-methylcytosine-specific restriction enzyme B